MAPSSSWPSSSAASPGVTALAGGILLAHRRLMDPRVRANSSLADTGILLLLLLQLVLGICTIFVSLGHLDGHEMTKFMAWAQGIFTFDAGAAGYIADVNPIFKAHLLLGLLIFVLFPFTRLVHMLSAPVRYLWRPGYQVVRSRRTAPLPARQPRPLPVASGQRRPLPGAAPHPAE